MPSPLRDLIGETFRRVATDRLKADLARLPDDDRLAFLMDAFAEFNADRAARVVHAPVPAKGQA